MRRLVPNSHHQMAGRNWKGMARLYVVSHLLWKVMTAAVGHVRAWVSQSCSRRAWLCHDFSSLPTFVLIDY
jgi:hypothetical protein